MNPKEYAEWFLTAERRCGRPTKKGTPCQNIIRGTTITCSTHSTEQSFRLMEMLRLQYKRGFDSGQKHTQWEVEVEKNRQARAEETAERAKAAAATARHRDASGAQLVEVDGYSYRWMGDTPLKVGDVVTLPRSEWAPAGREGTVNVLGSNYHGVHASIIARVR